jgi:hypothetical protein
MFKIVGVSLVAVALTGCVSTGDQKQVDLCAPDQLKLAKEAGLADPSTYSLCINHQYRERNK